MNRGADCPGAKLTDEIALECRRRWDEGRGETQAVLAKEFGVAISTVHRAIHGYNWAHLSEGVPDIFLDGRSSRVISPELRARLQVWGRQGAAARWGS